MNGFITDDHVGVSGQKILGRVFRIVYVGDWRQDNCNIYYTAQNVTFDKDKQTVTAIEAIGGISIADGSGDSTFPVYEWDDGYIDDIVTRYRCPINSTSATQEMQLDESVMTNKSDNKTQKRTVANKTDSDLAHQILLAKLGSYKNAETVDEPTVVTSEENTVVVAENTAVDEYEVLVDGESIGTVESNKGE